MLDNSRALVPTNSSWLQNKGRRSNANIGRRTDAVGMAITAILRMATARKWMLQEAPFPIIMALERWTPSRVVAAVLAVEVALVALVVSLMLSGNLAVIAR